MDDNEEYRLQAMNRKQVKREESRIGSMGNSYKFDNLNGGRMRQEYIDEIKQAQDDSYNHAVPMSEGFSNWLNEAYRNQHRERQEEAQRMRENMFPKKRDPHPMDEAFRERFAEKETQFQLRNRMRDVIFPDTEIAQRHADQKTTHPMDDFARRQLAEREQRKKMNRY